MIFHLHYLIVEKHTIDTISYSSHDSTNPCTIGDTHDTHTKCSDENDPHPPSYLPRGSGGVATIWPKEMSRCICLLLDGNERIHVHVVVIRYEPHDSYDNITIINTYFPCRGTDDHTAKFKNMLDQVHEIITKNSTSSRVIFCTDLNASLLQPKYPQTGLPLVFSVISILY